MAPAGFGYSKEMGDVPGTTLYKQIMYWFWLFCWAAIPCIHLKTCFLVCQGASILFLVKESTVRSSFLISLSEFANKRRPALHIMNGGGKPLFLVIPSRKAEEPCVPFFC